MFAAAAELLIPLTHKTLSTTLVLTTGHDPSLLNFEALARMDTVALVMATLTLEALVEGFLAAGKDPKTPVCLVRQATLKDREVLVATLDSVVEKTRGRRLSPAVVLIGPVAKFALEENRDSL